MAATGMVKQSGDVQLLFWNCRFDLITVTASPGLGSFLNVKGEATLPLAHR